MSLIIGKSVKVKEINCNAPIKIIYYLGKRGKIKGKKIIPGICVVPIVEFEDYTRVWILPEELDIL
uniref:cytochrome b6-f complex subunit n=1 Tax=Ahnfeltia fastigiata TaxID=31363 RepID=UPI001D11D6E7|nr:cytochrome b6-f complex subunit [Ahnfeltia fastigiata]UAT97692.1 cytochrome b6-f complex subunit [Ahnfeltia fastigiata]UAT97896.1 cytochrome b6-f complex subunit [Ahnfeltia fastigiata]